MEYVLISQDKMNVPEEIIVRARPIKLLVNSGHIFSHCEDELIAVISAATPR